MDDRIRHRGQNDDDDSVSGDEDDDKSSGGNTGERASVVIRMRRLFEDMTSEKDDDLQKDNCSDTEECTAAESEEVALIDEVVDDDERVNDEDVQVVRDTNAFDEAIDTEYISDIGNEENHKKELSKMRSDKSGSDEGKFCDEEPVNIEGIEETSNDYDITAELPVVEEINVDLEREVTEFEEESKSKFNRLSRYFEDLSKGDVRDDDATSEKDSENEEFKDVQVDEEFVNVTSEKDIENEEFKDVQDDVDIVTDNSVADRESSAVNENIENNKSDLNDKDICKTNDNDPIENRSITNDITSANGESDNELDSADVDEEEYKSADEYITDEDDNDENKTIKEDIMTLNKISAVNRLSRYFEDKSIGKNIDVEPASDEDSPSINLDEDVLNDEYNVLKENVEENGVDSSDRGVKHLNTDEQTTNDSQDRLILDVNDQEIYDDNLSNADQSEDETIDILQTNERMSSDEEVTDETAHYQNEIVDEAQDVVKIRSDESKDESEVVDISQTNERLIMNEVTVDETELYQDENDDDIQDEITMADEEENKPLKATPIIIDMILKLEGVTVNNNPIDEETNLLEKEGGTQEDLIDDDIEQNIRRMSPIDADDLDESAENLTEFVTFRQKPLKLSSDDESSTDQEEQIKENLEIHNSAGLEEDVVEQDAEKTTLSRNMNPSEDQETEVKRVSSLYVRPAPPPPVGNLTKENDLSDTNVPLDGEDIWMIDDEEVVEGTTPDYVFILPAFRMRSSSDSVLTGGSLSERIGSLQAAGGGGGAGGEPPSHATLQRNKSALHSTQGALGGSMTSLTSAPPTATPASSLSTSDLSERPRVSHGKPNLAPKPPTLSAAPNTDTRPSPPPKKLIVNGKIASRTQSMRVPRSPPVSPPSPQGGQSRPAQLPPAPYNPPIGTKNPASHFGTLRAPRGLRPPGVCPPPPPGAPPPPPARHASLAAPPPPPPPPHHRQHSTVSNTSEDVGVGCGVAPAPPVRGSSMRAELEARFAELFHPPASFPPPDPFLRTRKGYSSTTLAAKAQAPLPPLQVPLEGWSGTSSAC